MRTRTKSSQKRNCPIPYVRRIVLICLFVLPAQEVLGQKIEVIEEKCKDLDLVETIRLTKIEIAELKKARDEHEQLTIRFNCEGNSVLIQVVDSTNDRVVQRSIDRIGRNVEERVVALSASQLLAVTFLERAPASETRNSTDNDKEKQAEASQIRNRTLGERDLFLSSGIKLRRAFTLLAGRVGLRGDVWFRQDVGLMLLAGFEAGSISRIPGTVTTIATFLGMGVAGRVFRRERFFLELGTAAHLGYVYLRSNPKSWATGTSDGGVTGEFTLRAAPTLKFKKILLSLVLQAGYTIENPVGTMIGEDPITLGGFWMGANVCLGFVYLASKEYM